MLLRQPQHVISRLYIKITALDDLKKLPLVVVLNIKVG